MIKKLGTYKMYKTNEIDGNKCTPLIDLSKERLSDLLSKLT
nr:hypothetical protein [Sedimentibacter sp.]